MCILNNANFNVATSNGESYDVEIFVYFDNDGNEILVDSWLVNFSVDSSLSTKENQIESFSMYPNPTSLGYVNVSNKSSSKINASVFDLLGKQVIKEDLSNNQLNVSKLKSGVYIMKALQEGTSVTRKLVIQ